MLKEKISAFSIILCLLLKTQPILMDRSKASLNLLLVGKTGNGKSATGNTILGEKWFQTSSGVNSLTKDIKRGDSNHDGRKLTVVDSPGYTDTDARTTEVYYDNMSNAMQVSAQGYHAFLFVVRYGVRLTHEDELTFEVLSNCFGEEYFTRYGVLVVTFGDMYDPEENNGKLFSHWIHTQGGFLTDVKNKFGGRVVLFNNKNKGDAKRKAQVDHLIKIVDQLSVMDSRYTVEHFELATVQRERYLVQNKLPGIKLEVEKDLKMVIEMLNKINLDKPEKQINQLYVLRNIVAKLLTDIQEHDKDTGVLNGVITAIQKIAGIIQQGINDSMKRQPGNDMQEYGSGGVINNAINAAIYVLSYVYDIAREFFSRHERLRIT